MLLDSSYQTITSTAVENMVYAHHESHDFDEQATLLKGWNQAYSQISAGAFQGFVSELQLSQVSLFWEFTNQRLYQEGYLGEDSIAVGVPMNSIHNGMFCGTACEQNTIHLYSGKHGFEFVSPDSLSMGLIVIKRDDLMRLLSADDQYFLNLRCQQARVIKVSPSTYIGFIKFFQTTFSALKRQPTLIDNGHFTDEISANAMQLVIDSLLANHHPPSMHLMEHKSWQVLTHAREIVNDRLDNPITVAELCKSLAISHRSLHNHFRHTLATSPVAYLRAERLNGVRHMLKEASSVTEAATHWGFWHFGHFSHEYKKMFGELPSDTFKRLHAEAST